MYRFPIVCLGAALIVTAFGCYQHTDTPFVSYAAVRAQPTNALSELRQSPLPRVKRPPATMPSEDLPQLDIEVRFVEGPATGFPLAWPPWQQNDLVVSAEQIDELMNWTQKEPSSSVVSAPKLRVFSGSPASASTYSTFGFVQDFKLATDVPGFHVAQPVASQIVYGRHVDVQATLDGDAIVFDRIDVTNSELLGVRECEGTVVTSNGRETIAWKEPYVLQGTASGKGENLRVKPGQFAVLPLCYRVIQAPAANARAMANGGYVTEHYQNRFTPTTDDPNPLSRQCLVIVKAEVVENTKG